MWKWQRFADVCGLVDWGRELFFFFFVIGLDTWKQVRGKNVIIEEVTLRGAILDLDETAGFWLRDQELLYASWRLAEGGRRASLTPQRPSTTPRAKPPPPTREAPLSPLVETETPDKRAALHVNDSVASGDVVSHQIPTHLAMTLKDLAPQSLAIAVLGAKGVGKTEFVRSFMAASGNDKPATVQDLGTRPPPQPVSEKKVEVDGVTHHVTVIDNDVTLVENSKKGYLAQADAFVYLFDVTDRASFDILNKEILGLMVATRGHDPAVPVTIVANKIDLEPRVISPSETLALASELATLIKGSVALFECSSTRGTNVLDSFQDTFLNVLYWRACSASNREPGGYCVMQ
jgi:GTPase SAR1 family protein